MPSGYLLPGQPGLLTEKSETATVTLDDCAETVLEALRQVRHHRRVVLVAHSAGGGAASLAAERAPELLDRIVHLSAFVPAGRPRFLDYPGSPENATAGGQGLTLGDPEELGAVRVNPLSPAAAPDSRARPSGPDRTAPARARGAGRCGGRPRLTQGAGTRRAAADRDRALRPLSPRAAASA